MPGPIKGWSSQWWRGAGEPPAGWRDPADPLASPTGWGPVPPAATRDVYVRLVFATPLPQGDVVNCQAQNAATLYVDGVLAAGACDGTRHELSGSGSIHTLALHAQVLPSLQPWTDLFVGSPA